MTVTVISGHISLVLVFSQNLSFQTKVEWSPVQFIQLETTSVQRTPNAPQWCPSLGDDVSLLVPPQHRAQMQEGKLSNSKDHFNNSERTFSKPANFPHPTNPETRWDKRGLLATAASWIPWSLEWIAHVTVVSLTALP